MFIIKQQLKKKIYISIVVLQDSSFQGLFHFIIKELA